VQDSFKKGTAFLMVFDFIYNFMNGTRQQNGDKKGQDLIVKPIKQQ